MITSAHAVGQQIKIMNFQALIDKKYTHAQPEDSDEEQIVKNTINVHLDTNKGFQVTQNYVQPVFKIEKVRQLD